MEEHIKFQLGAWLVMKFEIRMNALELFKNSLIIDKKHRSLLKGFNIKVFYIHLKSNIKILFEFFR